jgi:hypothetical protein
MKYFSETWCSGDLTEEQSLAIRDGYWARIETLSPQFPATVRELATGINLHDALVRQVTLDRARGTLTISLRCGDLQKGYFDADLAYRGVEMAGLDPGTLRAIATDPNTELLYDEVDLESPGRFVHRILFTDTREIEIVFGGLNVATTPRPDRALGEVAGLYQEKSGAV